MSSPSHVYCLHDFKQNPYQHLLGSSAYLQMTQFSVWNTLLGKNYYIFPQQPQHKVKYVLLYDFVTSFTIPKPEV